MARKALAVILFLLSACQIYLIFFLSGQDADASSKVSTEVTLTLSEAINPEYMEAATKAQTADAVNLLHNPVRKLAHMAEFGALGALLCGAFLALRGPLPRRFFLCVILCAATSCADEAHQLFANGRAMMVKDMLIDFSGSMLGALAVMMSALSVLYIREHARPRGHRPKKTAHASYTAAPDPENSPPPRHG